MSFGEVVKSTINIVSKVTSTVGYRNVIDKKYVYDRTNPEELGGFVGVAECDLSCTVI